MDVKVFDLETDGLLKELTRVHCISIGDPKSQDVDLVFGDTIPEGISELAKADRLAAHNGVSFDLPALNKVYPGSIKLDQIWDTFLVAKILFPEIGDHRLKAWGERFRFPKGDHTDWSRYSPEMGEYCKQDSAITIKLYRALQSRLRKWMDKGIDWRQALEVEHKVAYVIAQQERHGFRLDVRKAQALEIELRDERNASEKELQAIFPPVYRPDKGTWDWARRTWINVEVMTPKVNNGPRGITKGAPYTKVNQEIFNPGSRQQCVFRLTSKYPWKPSKFTDGGAPQLDEKVLEVLLYPEAEALMRYFRLTKQLGQIADGDNSWLKLEVDGRTHGRVDTVGTRTFRMSHSKPNMAQVDKKDKRMREVWLPDEGHKLGGADAEGLELRMLGNRLYRYDGGEFARSVVEGKSSEGTDAHTRNQRLIGLYSRDSAKTWIYAFLYGAGNEKLGTIIIQDALAAGKPVPKGSAKTLGKASRDAVEGGITGLKDLIKTCKQRTKQVGYLKSLDGRPVVSPSEHSALNTLLQGDGALVMKYALVIFHYELCVEHGHVDPDDFTTKTFGYCANVHDEVQISAPEEIIESLLKLFCRAIEMAGERLKVRCPLAGSYAIGDNWKDTH